jgi:hypothetical protein
MTDTSPCVCPSADSIALPMQRARLYVGVMIETRAPVIVTHLITGRERTADIAASSEADVDVLVEIDVVGDGDRDNPLRGCARRCSS